jgi:hypothetical protein
MSSDFVKKEGLHFKNTKKGNIFWHFGKSDFLYYQTLLVEYLAFGEVAGRKILERQVLREMFVRCFNTLVIPEKIKIKTSEAIALVGFFRDKEEEMMVFELTKLLGIWGV